MPKMPDFTKTTGRIYYRKNAAPANPVFLENFLRLTPTPLARVDSLTGETVDPCRDEFSAFIFKIQANMNLSLIHISGAVCVLQPHRCRQDRAAAGWALADAE